MACILFCAAEFDGLERPVLNSDYILAADGGLRHTESLGITPHEVIGDFDSLGYTPDGGEVHPVEKDDTDTMLCIKRGLSLGYREFLIYGGMDGPRVDHTMANFQALSYLADHGARGYLIGKNSIASVIQNGEISFPAGCQGDFSAFCLGADARGITLRGLYYPLENGSLTAHFPLGVSNHFTGEKATIRVQDGTLLLIWSRKAHLGEEMR